MKMLLVAVGMLAGSNAAWGATETYDFTAHTGTFTYPASHITYSTSNWGYLVTDTWLNGRFSFQDGTTSGNHRDYWQVRTFKTNDVYVTGLNNTQSTAYVFGIHNLVDGDIIVITMPDASNDKIFAVTTNMKKENQSSPVVADEQIISEQRYVVTTLDETTSVEFKGNQYCCISNIQIITDDVKKAIKDVKTFETSGTFATYIDGLKEGGSLTNAEQVYAAHTAWQIAQADAVSSNDYTKVIRNAAVADATDWAGAGIYSGEQYTGAPDAYFIDNNGAQMWATQWVYGLPAGKYQVKVATRANADNYSHVYVSYNGEYDICTARGTHVGNTGGDLGNGWSWTYVPFEITEKANILLGFYKDATNWAGADDWHLYKVTDNQPVEISAVGWATLFTPYALDFSGVEGLTAYTASVSENSVTLTEVSDVPANTGVVLKGDANTYNIPLAASSNTAQGDLKGSPTWATVYNAESGYTYYILTKDGENDAEFNPVNSGEIAAGKAYLRIANSTPSRSLTIVFNDATGISSMQHDECTLQNEVYNLNGQRIVQPRKGLYIVNGKKTVIR